MSAMASDIASDPRFSHVLSDPRFKTIPRRTRKVRIGSRFQSMFTSSKFKVKYRVDKRGRRLQQTSSEDMRKYYDLHDDAAENAVSNDDVMKGNPPPEARQQGRRLKKGKSAARGEGAGRRESAALSGVAVDVRETETVSEGNRAREGQWEGGHYSESDGTVTDSDDSGSDTSTDVEEIMALREPEVVHGWWDDEVSPAHSVETGSKLALCRMDWDRVNATDIFVFLSSFKPEAGSIVRVSVLPSDFGLERMQSEDKQGPTELLSQSDDTLDEGSLEGRGYSNERLRQYQLQRLNFYYAVVECDSPDTASHVYEQCDGLEYEHCGGKLDLRFIPDDMTFDDREPKSVATETSIRVDYTPPEFVTAALQQSRVQLTWDETDPRRLQTTMRKFSREDMLQMDYDAYLASSSSGSGDEFGSSGEGGGEPNTDHSRAKHSRKVAKYRSLLVDGEEGNGDGVSGEEVMEISWEPGLREEVQGVVRRRQEEGETTWERYRRERGKKVKEKRSMVKGSHDDDAESHGIHGDKTDGDLRFDDPFFQQDVATTSTGKKATGKKSAKEVKEEKQAKSQLQLLMMEDGEDSGKAHFSLDSILKQERGPGKKKARRRRDEELPAQPDSFEVDVSDPRFTALYSNHLYAPDPAHPQYRSTKGMSAIVEERRKRKERGGAMQQTSDRDADKSQFTDPSVGQLVKAVKSKTSSLNERRKKLRAKKTALHV